MMIILSKREYDDLVLKATSLEAEVEKRVEVEKQRILLALKNGLSNERTWRFPNQVEQVRHLINELLR